MDYSDFNTVRKLVEDQQSADDDMRINVRDAHLFVDKKDGQWEPFWFRAWDNQPRYTFDKTSPIIQNIANQFMKSDFGIDVKPASGAASKEKAKILDGIIRNIQNRSNAQRVFSVAARNMVTGGIDGWRVVQEYENDRSFNQTLKIIPIPNFVDSVWFDGNSTEQDASDAQWCTILKAMTTDAYKERWPDAIPMSFGDSRHANAYYDKPADQVKVGEFLYKKVIRKAKLIEYDNGTVLEEGNKDDERAALYFADLGIKPTGNERTVDVTRVFTRFFDANGWLGEESETVFDYLPVIPTYGHFKIIEDKITYRGVVEKLMDAQRVYNYSRSREIREGALAPMAKYWMTPKQAKGHTSSLSTMNTNNNPVQFFEPDERVPGIPQMSGGAIINAGLAASTQQTSADIAEIAGRFETQQGQNPNLQSGVAIEQVQEAGNDTIIHFFEAQEVAISHTYRVIVDALPRLMDTKRTERSLNEDGSFEMVEVDGSLFDGEYDVVCRVGKSYKSKQSEAVAGIIEVAGVDPSIIQEGGDILMNSMDFPGAEELAQRKRKALFDAGLIPQEQWTEEERAMVQQQQMMAAQNPPPPDPMMIAAQAEMQKAQAEMQKNQIQSQKNQIEAQKIALKEQEMMLKMEKERYELMLEVGKADEEQAKAAIDGLNKQIESLDKLKNVMGAGAILSPQLMQAFETQVDQVSEMQNGLDRL